MRAASLILRSLRYYWRTHLPVVAGMTVASAVVVGALVVGDSVRGSLKALALARLGETRLALAMEDRFFREQLADEMASALAAPAAPVLQVRGLAVTDRAKVNDVYVLGVEERFWALGRTGMPAEEPGGNADLAGQAVINERLARQLGVRAGDSIVLGVDKPGLMPRDAPLAVDVGSRARFTLIVRAVASDAQFGRFSLRADQIAPYNVFVPLRWLQDELGLGKRANVLLIGAGKKGEVTPERAAAALHEHWKLPDIGLETRKLADQGAIELRSGRVFLDPAAVRAALAAAPDALAILTYFVNELRVGERAAPYSFVSAVGEIANRARPLGTVPASRPGTDLARLLPPDMGDDEILINAWLEKNLDARPGQRLTMSYFVLGPMRQLTERTKEFRIRGVVPLERPGDPELMPAFPGLADVGNCRDWQPGIPIDLGRIRDEDQKYWDDNGGTPKAFITLKAGQPMWENAFGSLTALRWPAAKYSREQLAEAIRRRLDPVAMGLFFQPVRRQALAASTQALDFRQLFLGLSFFLVVAAFLLMGLLFVFGIVQRGQQVGTLLALGFPPRRVRRLLLSEGAALALLGTVLGAPLGLLYTRVVLGGLSTVWRSAVAASKLGLHARSSTLAIGSVGALLVAGAIMSLALRRQGRRPARELLAGLDAQSALPARSGTKGRASLWVALVGATAAVVAVILAGAGNDQKAVGAFFAAGALLLTAGVALSYHLLAKLARASKAAGMTLGKLGLRNSSRRRGRSLAVVALLACGSFLVIAVGANRLHRPIDAQRRSSGTGGFAFFGQSAMQVFRDLHTAAGREAYGLDAADLAGVKIVHVRVREGDDASCLNLNRAQKPRLLGVRPAKLKSRFTFVKTAEGFGGKDGWELLTGPGEDDTVPAIGDVPTITWALGKSVGETLPYVDEMGRTFHIRIVGSVASSILQGSLIISEDDFRRRFPSVSGYRALLVDCPPAKAEQVGRALTGALRDEGLELMPAVERLAAFNAVQNTYLSIFQLLGGLGLGLGSIGLGIVVLRNVLERRSELALFRAVGFSRRSLRWMILCEHWWLLLLGLACGVIAALVAVTPALRAPGARVPFGSLSLTLLAVVASGVAWTYLATVAAVRGPLLDALRHE